MEQTLEQTFCGLNIASEQLESMLKLTEFLRCSCVSEEDICTDSLLSIYAMCLASVSKTVDSLCDACDKALLA